MSKKVQLSIEPIGEIIENDDTVIGYVLYRYTILEGIYYDQYHVFYYLCYMNVLQKLFLHKDINGDKKIADNIKIIFYEDNK